jgi:hypothetical protein
MSVVGPDTIIAVHCLTTGRKQQNFDGIGSSLTSKQGSLKQEQCMIIPFERPVASAFRP